MKKVGKKKFIILLILCVVFAAISLFIGYGVPILTKQNYTEEKTNEYTAYFQYKEKSNDYYVLYLNNCKCSLQVNSATIIDEKAFDGLTNGTKIIFRSVFIFDASSQREDVLPVVSLKTDKTEIVTLESTRNALTSDDIKIKITATVFSVFFLIGAVVCVLYVAGVLKTKSKPKTEQEQKEWLS